MMRFLLKIFLVFAAAVMFHGAARAASFTVSLDRDTITLGDRAMLSLKFQGAAPQSLLNLPKIPGMNIAFVGQQSLDSNIYGVPDSTVTFTYALMPQKVGEFIIPALTAPLAGQMVTSQPLKLTVQKAAAPIGDNDAAKLASQFAFMRLTLPKTNLYVGESIVAQLQIYYRQDTEIAQQPQITGLPAEGFSVGKIVSGDQRQVQIGNAVFNQLSAGVALTATKTGAPTVGPFTLNLVLSVPSSDGGGGEQARIFRQMGIQMRESKRFPLATEILTLQSLPLPSGNRPADFASAVGDYTMNVTVGPTNLPAGDPVTLRVQISGRGALDTVTLPDLSGWSGFKTYPPTSRVQISDQLGLEGTKNFEQIVAPQNSDIHAVPQFSFSFFNPGDGKYHTLTQASVPLVVNAVKATTLPPLPKNAAPENPAPQDILPLKQNLGTLVQIPAGQNSVAPLVSKPLFLVAQAAPVLAFLAALIWRKRTDRLANNPRLRRKIAVAQLVQNGLNDLKKFAAENKPDEFFALLFRLLQEQLGERLDCPATAITENVVEENSLLRHAPNSTRDGLRELFQFCNQARYAPVRGTSELNSVAVKFEKTIRELQEIKA